MKIELSYRAAYPKWLLHFFLPPTATRLGFYFTIENKISKIVLFDIGISRTSPY